MNTSVLQALLPLLLALVGGFVMGKALSKSVNAKLIQSITPLVWLMLFFIGFEFGEVVFSAGALGTVLVKAVVFAVLTTLVPCVLIVLLVTQPSRNALVVQAGSRWQAALPAVKEVGIALSMVVCGIILFVVLHWLDRELSLPSSSVLLLFLIVLVGVDLAQIDLKRSWLSRQLLIVPALVWLGSWLAALPAAWLCGETLTTALGLSSGFGWFTLSSVLFGEKMGHEYGMLALMIDLFRELIAITLIYLLGRKHPQIVVASAGAAAADTTLPMIKASCGNDFIPLAMVSGVLLSLLAPFLMTFFIY